MRPRTSPHGGECQKHDDGEHEKVFRPGIGLGTGDVDLAENGSRPGATPLVIAFVVAIQTASP
jgi:hypothetical protein